MNDDITLNANLLVIDDSLLILRIIQEILKDRYNVQLASSANKAFSYLKDFIPDLILLDLEMPKKNGFEVLQTLKENPKWKDIPVLFLTGQDKRQKEEKALDMGAVDYITKPISAGVLRKRIQMHLELQAYQKKLESLVTIRTTQLLKTQDLILDILASVTTYRDNDTGEHILRTTNYSKLIVEKLLEIRHPYYQISPIYADNIIKSAKLHDIGKIGISDEILLKPARLTQEEFESIKKHTVIGAKMIDNAISELGDDASFLNTAKEIILYHHEWWNGEGYPTGAKANEIPISARIMAIADVYDALISSRPYKKSFSHEETVNLIKKEAGSHFDPVLVAILDDVFPKFREIAQLFKDKDFKDKDFKDKDFKDKDKDF